MPGKRDWGIHGGRDRPMPVESCFDGLNQVGKNPPAIHIFNYFAAVVARNPVNGQKRLA